MQRLIVTGTNGVGKSHVATRLSLARPEIPLVSFDAIKLTRDWVQRPRSETDQELAEIVATNAWILEGGPSLLPMALKRADAVLWLDPPEGVRIWHLIKRPWQNLGQTRAELPDGNVDWPLRQYAFAWKSIKKQSASRAHISNILNNSGLVDIIHCKTHNETDAAIDEWRRASASVEVRP